MNEKIKQLAEQADKYAWASGNWFEADFRTKFAELIVKECIEQVKPTQHHEVWAQSYLGGVDGLDLLYSKVKDIKKHFGATPQQTNRPPAPRLPRSPCLVMNFTLAHQHIWSLTRKHIAHKI